MSLKQLTVFVENKQGALVEITSALARSEINIRALSIADTEEFSRIVTRRVSDGARQELELDGMFVAIGLVPENDAFASLADLDQVGYFDSAEDCLTKTPGIFVAGDCRTKKIRQVTTASADGAIAALAACRYIDGL